MRFVIFCICTLFLWAPSASGQVSPKTFDPQYVIAPAENILLTVAAQPDCPLKIEDAQLLVPVSGGQARYRYSLVNRGSKPIRYFTVVAWNSTGTGGTLSGPAPWDGRVTTQVLRSGQSVTVGKDQISIAPLSPSLREKLNLNGKLKAVIVLLVDQITFDDGSKYDAQPASKSLIDYFVDLAK